MTPTITVTDEAQAFFAREPDPALRKLVDQGVSEYGEFWGKLPVVVDALEDPETGREDVCIALEVDATKGSMMERYHVFMNGWRSRHSREEQRAVRFSIRYF